MKNSSPSSNWLSNLKLLQQEASVEAGMSLEQYLKYDNIKAVLETFQIVQWDRWSGTIDNCVVFGWINRKQDNYKDFLTIDFYQGKPTAFATSSAKHSAAIAQLLGFEHSDCMRVEDNFDIKNVIKLGDK